ncbi:excinuclease ABC subunit UvrC, partial [bacterium]|nr:excinuclease ABC subunit UvrC [bacterium]
MNSAMELSVNLAEKLKNLPDSPGCYLMRNSQNRVIYVGKSSCLRKRVRSYFQKHDHPERVKWMISLICDFDILTVSTEMEALLLENNLIKKYNPRFNVLLKDDKQYPALELTTYEKFPRLRVVRLRSGSNTKGLIFGPYANGADLARTKKLVQKLFLLRPCKDKLEKTRSRPCLYYQLKMCSAPCLGRLDPNEYGQQVERAKKFLCGHNKGLISDLHQQMEIESQRFNYELCAQIRDTLKTLELITEKQQVVFKDEIDEDYLALACDSERSLCCILIWQVREGRLQSQQHFFLESRLLEETATLEGFIQQYYAMSKDVPPVICLPYLPNRDQLLLQWLESLSSHKVKFVVPKRGAKKQLLQKTDENARRNLQEKLSLPTQKENRLMALQELQKALGLTSPLQRLECYDISNIQGKYAVGSMVVFEEGMPQRSHYRKFKIQGLDTPNDFAMMRQVLARRLSHLPQVPLELASSDEQEDSSLSSTPDLIIVDGGLGQLGVAIETLEKYHLNQTISLAGLAKKKEELFLPDKSQPIILPEDSNAYNLVTHLRNEAHRFAITFHR